MMADEIKSIRKALGMTQQEFAHTLGVHAMSVSRWERGKLEPSQMAVNFMRVLQRVPKLIDPDHRGS